MSNNIFFERGQMADKPNNYLWNGDCLELMKDIPDKSIDLIITDPPYWHKKSPGKPYAERNPYKTNSKYANSKLFNVEGEMLTKFSDFRGEDINTLLNEFKRLMSKMNCYIFCNDVQLAYYGMWAEENKKHFSVLVWEKPLSIINKNRFSQHLEYIVRIYDYGTGLNRYDNMSYLYSKVKRYKQNRGNSKLHPTQKPIELIKELLLVSSKKNDLILDPFTGSGTTLVSCDDLGRRFIGIELDEKYYKVAKKRVEKNILLRANEQQTLFKDKP